MPRIQTVYMSEEKQCKGSVRFQADTALDAKGKKTEPRIQNIYLKRPTDGGDMPESITVHIDTED